MWALDFLGQSMAPLCSGPCCTPACDLGLSIRPFGHTSPPATCPAWLPIPKFLCTRLPTRNFLCHPCTALCLAHSGPRVPLPPIPQITPLCLPHSASSLHHCQQRGLPVTEAESSRSRPCHPTPCSLLLVIISFPFGCPSFFAFPNL